VDELVKNGRNPADYSIAQLRLVYLAKTEDQAWADTQEHLFNMLEFYGDIAAEANDVPGDKDAFPFKSPLELRDSPLGRAVWIGTPDQVARKIESFTKDFHCTHLILSTQMAGMDPRKATNSLELFAKEIMPEYAETGGWPSSVPPGSCCPPGSSQRRGPEREFRPAGALAEECRRMRPDPARHNA
jgi:alkanesulfonate monooxygenase SsuD/methylene tetrahydromethanopterin reductase-like flavin-dependent oxidoreductase (luciferase family)